MTAAVGDTIDSKTALKTAAAGLRGEARWRAPLSEHTTLGVGGPADLLAIPADLEDLRGLAGRARAAGLPLFVLGGSNLLVQDGGLRGIVVKLARLDRIEAIDALRLEAEAGVPLPRLARWAAERGLGGLEFAVGIPGTLGGGVVMNAGTPDGEVGNFVEAVRVLTPDGALVEAARPEIGFSYRASRLPAGIVVAARLALEQGRWDEIRKRLQDHSRRRRATQPLNLPNAGSVFKNPPGDFAARLIEAAGLKGARIGDAQISERHANFIVNRGAATARDALALIARARATVERTAGVRLELELKVVGEAPQRE